MATLAFGASNIEEMRQCVGVASDESSLVWINPLLSQVGANCGVIAVVNFLHRLPFSLKSGHSGCVRDSVPVGVELLPILLGVEERLTLDHYVSVDMPDTEHMGRLWKDVSVSID